VTVALIKLRALQDLDDSALQGVAHTISQLSRLGLSPAVVVDCESENMTSRTTESRNWREELVEQSTRMVSALERELSIRASRLDFVLGTAEDYPDIDAALAVQGAVQVQYPEILMSLLKRRNIPVLTPIAYTIETQKVQKVPTDEVVLALTREFAGLGNRVGDAAGPSTTRGPSTGSANVALDRIILLDPLGGLPSSQREDSAHIFVNLEQEYGEIRADLLGSHALSSSGMKQDKRASQDIRKFKLASVATSEEQKQSEFLPVTNRNVKNLDLLQKALAILPPSASAMLTTPHEAATFSTSSKQPSFAEFGVITRRPKNPLIHNLLTDKALISSSLPAARLHASVSAGSRLQNQPTRATFVKRGMPLTMIPDPRLEVWEPPRPSKPPLRLDDPRIDLSRLINLIEDSFNRPLDIEHYMDRIRNNLAGVIVAGEYEGGAILTWELPPGVPDDGSESSRKRMVPYLDKFAVLKRSQGAGGVADIVFSAMVRTCFPNGVCWRSRKDNPVNKWYFERSDCTYKIPETNWSAFWTTEDVYADQQKFRDYVDICRVVQPSWADSKKPAD
jgi:amino-acid N-acetyltransferase